jgi:hypothetical protein
VNQHRVARAGRLEPLVFPGEAEPGALRSWLRAARPDVVINAVPGVYELLLGFGLRLPEDLGFVHLDLSPRLKAAGVTGIDQLSGIVGAAALELVVNQLNTNLEGPPEHPVTQLIEGAWFEGQTVRPAVHSAVRPAGAGAGAFSAPLGGAEPSGRSAVAASGRRSGG